MKTLVYRLDITLVTVTSVLFRIAKASATGFGSEICDRIIQIEHSFKSTSDTNLQLRPNRWVFAWGKKKKARLIMELRESHR